MQDREDWLLTPDGVDQALEHLLPRSAGALVREAFYGAERFDEFTRRTDLPRSVVSQQLRRLVDTGVLEKAAYQDPGARQRQGYRLTDRGRDLGVVLVAMMDWSRRWLLDAAEPGVLPAHRDCGATVHAHLRCDTGHLLDIAEVDAVVGPGARRHPDTGTGG